MNYYQTSRQFIKRNATALNQQLESKRIKKIKRIVIIIFVALLILDVVFVIPTTPFPTISKVVLLSSPKNLFIIWLWGVATANIFFPRKIKNPLKIKIIGFVALIVITVPLYFAGRMISNQAQGLICNDGSQAPNAYFTEIICYSDDERKIDCSNSNIACAGVRVDINTLTKTILLVAGMLFGYFLFPQYEKKANAVESNST
jgi:hypothetical protein